MTMMEKLDILDLLITALKEHEKILDTLEKKFEKLIERVEVKLDAK